MIQVATLKKGTPKNIIENDLDLNSLNYIYEKFFTRVKWFGSSKLLSFKVEINTTNINFCIFNFIVNLTI